MKTIEAYHTEWMVQTYIHKMFNSGRKNVPQSNKIIERLRNYLKHTSLHGFVYIEKFNFPSIFWAIICILCTGLCISLVRKHIIIYENNRLLTSIATTAYPIWRVPFPAVTLCNYNVVYKSNMEPVAESLLQKEIPEAEIDDFFMNLSSNVLHDTLDGEHHYQDIITVLNADGIDTNVLMQKVAQPCDRLLKRCVWLSKEVNCTHLFRSIKTTFGYCCSFNYRGPHHQFTLNMSSEVPGIGPRFGLEVDFDSEPSEYMSAIEPQYGVKVLIHNNHHFPNEKTTSTAVLPRSDITFTVVPEITQSDEDLRDLDVNIRGCIFSDERKLNWSSIYTYSNCMCECQAELIIKQCGCIPFYYIRTDNRRICDLLDLECLHRIRGAAIISEQAKYSLPIDRHQKENELFDSTLHTCACYTDCNEVTYTYVADERTTTSVVGFESVSNYSKIRIYFAKTTCLQISRALYMTWDMILASIGGIFGLCLGGSIMSLIEIIYHIVQAIIEGIIVLYNSSNKRKKIFPRLSKTKGPTIHKEKIMREQHLYWRDFDQVQKFHAGYRIQKRPTYIRNPFPPDKYFN